MVQLNRKSILEIQDIAKRGDSKVFYIHTRRLDITVKAEWIDPFLGLILIYKEEPESIWLDVFKETFQDRYFEFFILESL